MNPDVSISRAMEPSAPTAAGGELRLVQALDDLRRRRGISQQELARRLGRSQSAVSQFFSAGSGITIERLIEYLSALGLRARIEITPAEDGEQSVIVESHVPPDPAEVLRQKRKEILEIAKRHGASNVRVFGSLARGEMQRDSDVDFLVEFEEGRSLLDQVHLIEDLKALFGRDVDVVEADTLHRMIRDRALAEAVPV